MGGIFKPLRGRRRRLRFGVATLRPVMRITTNPTLIRGVLGGRMGRRRRVRLPVRSSGRVPPVGILSKILRFSSVESNKFLLG